MQKGQIAVLQSSFGELPCPVLARFIGFDAADFLFGTIQRSLGDAFGFCRCLDSFTQHRLAVRKHIQNQLLGGSGFGFRIKSAEQFISGDVIVAIQPAETALITQTESDGLSFRGKGRFIVDNDTDIGFFLHSADQQNTSCCRTEVDRTKTAAAEDLIRDLLSDGEKVPCETIFSMAASRGILQRTVNQAKKNIPEIVTTKPSKKWFWQIPK